MEEHNKFDQAVIDFVKAFENVFHNDWEYTLWNFSMPSPTPLSESERISADRLIRDVFGLDPEAITDNSIEGPSTFLHPVGVENDEVPDWGNYTLLLRSYRNLLAVMQERGLSTVPSEPDSE